MKECKFSTHRNCSDDRPWNVPAFSVVIWFLKIKLHNRTHAHECTFMNWFILLCLQWHSRNHSQWLKCRKVSENARGQFLDVRLIDVPAIMAWELLCDVDSDIECQDKDGWDTHNEWRLVRPSNTPSSKVSTSLIIKTLQKYTNSASRVLTRGSNMHMNVMLEHTGKTTHTKLRDSRPRNSPEGSVLAVIPISWLKTNMSDISVINSIEKYVHRRNAANTHIPIKEESPSNAPGSKDDIWFSKVYLHTRPQFLHKCKWTQQLWDEMKSKETKSKHIYNDVISTHIHSQVLQWWQALKCASL